MAAPRLRPLTNDELPPTWTARLAADEQNDILRIFGHHPEAFASWNTFYRTHVMSDGVVPMRVKELMRLRIEQLNECRF